MNIKYKEQLKRKFFYKNTKVSNLYKPDVICPGFSRSGTTFIHVFLRSFPNVLYIERNTGLWCKHLKDKPENLKDKIILDFSDMYDSDYLKLSLNAAFYNCRNIKVIICIRNPIEAVISAYLQFDFKDKSFPERISLLNKYFTTKYAKNYKFKKIVSAWLSTFKNVLILDVVDNEKESLDKLQSFIKLPKMDEKPNIYRYTFRERQICNFNKDRDIPKYSIDLWKELRDYYYEDIEYISTLINVPKDKWLNEPNPRYFKI